MTNQRGPANGVYLGWLIMTPEIFSYINIQAIVSQTQPVTNDINYCGNTHGIHIFSICYFDFHPFLKTVIWLVLQLKHNKKRKRQFKQNKKFRYSLTVYLFTTCILHLLKEMKQKQKIWKMEKTTLKGLTSFYTLP